MAADILVFCFVLIFVYTGYKTGLIRTVYGILSYFIAIIVSAFIYPYVSRLLSESSFVSGIASSVSEKISGAGATEYKGQLGEYLYSIVGNTINSAVAAAVLNIISFALVLVLVRLTLGVISKSLNIFSRLPVISGVNRLCGAVAGGIKGIIILYIVFLVVLLVPELGGGAVGRSISSSQIANKFYTENIIIDVLGKDIFSLNGK